MPYGKQRNECANRA
ncbi:unnamed protein product [Victoria cruziana]